MAAQLPEAVRRPAGVAIAATVLWGIGISPVPRVYTEPDPVRRLELLRAGHRAWVIGEHLAAAGTAAGAAAFCRIACAPSFRLSPLFPSRFWPAPPALSRR